MKGFTWDSWGKFPSTHRFPFDSTFGVSFSHWGSCSLSARHQRFKLPLCSKAKGSCGFHNGGWALEKKKLFGKGYWSVILCLCSYFINAHVWLTVCMDKMFADFSNGRVPTFWVLLKDGKRRAASSDLDVTWLKSFHPSPPLLSQPPLFPPSSPVLLSNGHKYLCRYVTHIRWQYFRLFPVLHSQLSRCQLSGSHGATAPCLHAYAQSILNHRHCNTHTHLPNKGQALHLPRTQV